MDNIAKNIVRKKKKEEKEERDLLKKTEQVHNKAIRNGTRAAKEASKSNNAKLRLDRKASKNN